jgi:hypothetical protein
MIEELEKLGLEELEMPLWLKELTPESMVNDPLPLNDLLENSLYYPSAGSDGTPIRYLAGNIYSFFYVDYCKEQEKAINDIQKGCKGYDLLAMHSLPAHEELLPEKWPLPASDRDPHSNEYSSLRFESWIVKDRFCIWAIFQRKTDFPSSHGPERFSLLYLSAEGLTVFTEIYGKYKIVPKAIAIIQPGHGFGANWTNFEDPKAIFPRTVLSNPNGQPEMLLHGGIGGIRFYREPCWPSYNKLRGFHMSKSYTTVGFWTK